MQRRDIAIRRDRDRFREGWGSVPSHDSRERDRLGGGERGTGRHTDRDRDADNARARDIHRNDSGRRDRDSIGESGSKSAREMELQTLGGGVGVKRARDNLPSDAVGNGCGAVGPGGARGGEGGGGLSLFSIDTGKQHEVDGKVVGGGDAVLYFIDTGKPHEVGGEVGGGGGGSATSVIVSGSNVYGGGSGGNTRGGLKEEGGGEGFIAVGKDWEVGPSSGSVCVCMSV